MSPFGMALVGDTFYVANADAVVRVPVPRAATRRSPRAPVKVADLPGAPRNHHWTKSLVAAATDRSCTSASAPTATSPSTAWTIEDGRAAIHEIDAKTGARRVFASGLRNPVGMAWQPQSGMLWTVVNERDELGSDLVPDYLTSVRDGAFYGWPYSYYGAACRYARGAASGRTWWRRRSSPTTRSGAHVASLGLAFYDGKLLPARYANGAFIGLHGSWNRDPPSGYKVVFVPFANGKPAGDHRGRAHRFPRRARATRAAARSASRSTKRRVAGGRRRRQVVWRVVPSTR